jgi:GAF domain-containing protein
MTYNVNGVVFLIDSEKGGGVMEKTSTNYYQELYKIASIMNSERTPRVLLLAIVESVTRALGAKACSLMLLSPDGETLLHTIAYGLSREYLRKGPIKADKSISEALQGKPVAIFNASEDDRIMYQPQVRKEGIASILCLPIRLRGKIIGALRVYTAQPYHFTEDDITFAETVANLGAVALENLRAYEIIQKEYDDMRTEMLQRRAEMGDEWMSMDSVTPSREKLPLMPPGG